MVSSLFSVMWCSPRSMRCNVVREHAAQSFGIFSQEIYPRNIFYCNAQIRELKTESGFDPPFRRAAAAGERQGRFGSQISQAPERRVFATATALKASSHCQQIASS